MANFDRDSLKCYRFSLTAKCSPTSQFTALAIAAVSINYTLI
ncbi:hypothetical protein [Halotia branconii]|uniref:Uncharacterized protein n=1 Tax=Halotia branconii CENA392 TaxID=1539056 RepID=A0AAJ6NNF8_9CYAN|nr:hypothetical protein [Halotia branconii]WGV23740.1 hypothetical protein QI031_18205 [Halotia branconii CENA392]